MMAIRRPSIWVKGGGRVDQGTGLPPSPRRHMAGCEGVILTDLLMLIMCASSAGRARINLTASLAQMHGPSRFTSSTRRHSSVRPSANNKHIHTSFFAV
ncbi:hypothetical protein LSTR_LSTR017398 [Laodelphax striatellus]|uniref:Uncharacterized protein n=1 Tax=Laodelphax striatellus TaxID=195883 RepID=A0A482XP24_LAOST|nr:hypothetical protein LSTR_LSTR017398 [Laodelphax striatellus]